MNEVDYLKNNKMENQEIVGILNDLVQDDCQHPLYDLAIKMGKKIEESESFGC